MTSPSTDPQPEETPGLQQGGSVNPGDTPPGEAGMSGVSHREPRLPSRRTNAVVYGVVIAVVLLTAVLFGAYAAGLLD